jgi:hypothetical protein
MNRFFCSRLSSIRRSRRSLCAATFCVLFAAAGSAFAAPPAPYPLVLPVGSPGEQSLVVKNAGSALIGTLRHADKGQFWVYGLTVVPGARCRLMLALDTDAATVPPAATVLGLDNKPIPNRTERDPNGDFAVVWTVPDKWPYGVRLSVMISAKDGPTSIKSVSLSQTLPDSNGDGLPDSIERLLVEGMPAGVRPTVYRPPAQPYTVTTCTQPLSPAQDVQTDAVFSTLSDPSGISAWKARGYAVWTPGGAQAGKDFLLQNRDDVQTGRDGKPILFGDRALLAASLNVLNADRNLFAAALAGGSDGVCFVEPEYAARAGYEPAFKQAWQTQYQAAWQDPVSGIDARFHASMLMATSTANRVQSVLQDTLQRRPGARRMVTLHSPLYTAQSGLVSPLSRIAALNPVTDIIGDVSMSTAGLPTRYEGLRQEMLFDRSFLEYSAFWHAGRAQGKRAWFLTNPLPDMGLPVTPEARSRYEQTLVAALLLPDVNAYQLALPPDTLTATLPPEDAIRLHSILAALEDMHNQTALSGNAEKYDDIGVLVSDSAQWQREGPDASDLDGLFGLTLPLLQRGVPVQVLSLDRVADPGYLSGFKTLLVSYDFQKPPGARAQQALAEWVRRGGSLLYFGGADAYNGVSDAWWRQAGWNAPQQELWKQLGVNAGMPTAQSAPSEDASRYTVVLKAANNERAFGNRRAYQIDLTPFARQTGSVAVRFSALSPNEAGGAYVTSGELAVGGRVAASFVVGSEIENRFLMYDRDSQFDGKNRIAQGSASWTYQFDNLPRKAPITLTLDMANGFVVSATDSRPDFGHTLLSTGANAFLSKLFPRLRIGASYAATLYPLPDLVPSPVPSTANNANAAGGGDTRVRALIAPPALTNTPTALYTLREGGNPVWMQNVGRGLALNVGVAPGFFSASERSAGLLRALTRFAYQRAGGDYNEPGSLRLRRGRYVIVRTFSEPYTVEGRMIDVLSPTLNVADDRVIPPDSVALLYDIGVPEADPHIGFVSGRVQAKAETATATAFYVRGAAGTTGVARLHRGNRRLTGARGMDWLGRPIPVQAQEDGGTVLLRYANDPDGVIIRAGWQ